ncbi:uncharacterized protein [Parasteatoda tepidariorum]|uniref:uncharacterized protein n=1 Tax=Parasteatoda tepidariorum TaxID=114398 RepID=UPI001C71ACB1|nr:uncharacterized protein LOC107436924 [Parasteatoda tepidariorum]
MIIFLKIFLVLRLMISLFDGKYSLYFVEAGILKSQTLKEANGQTENKRDIEKENTKMYHIMAQHIGPNVESKDLNVKYPNYDVLEFDEKKIDSLKQIKNITETATKADSPYTMLNVLNNKRRSVQTNQNRGRSFGNEDESNSIVAIEKTDPLSLRTEFDSSFHSSKPREVFKHRRQAFKKYHRKLYGPPKQLHGIQKSEYNSKQSMIDMNPSNTDFQNNMVVSKEKPLSTPQIFEKVSENNLVTEENESANEADTEQTPMELLTQLYAHSSDQYQTSQYPFTPDIYSTKYILVPLTNGNESSEYLTEEIPFSNSTEVEISTENPYDGYVKAGPIRIKISNDTSPHKLQMGIRPNSNTNLTFRIERHNGEINSDTGSELKNVEKKDVSEKTIANKNVQFERDIYKLDNINNSLNLNASMLSDSNDVSNMAFPLWQLSKDSKGRVKWDLRQNSEKSKYVEISNKNLNDDSELESDIIYGTDSSGLPKLKVYPYNCKTLILNIFRKHTVAAVVIIIIILFIFVLFIYVIYKAGQRSQYIKYSKLDDSKDYNKGNSTIESIGEGKKSRKKFDFRIPLFRKGASGKDEKKGKRGEKVSQPVILKDSRSQMASFQRSQLSSSDEGSNSSETKASRKNKFPKKSSRSIQRSKIKRSKPESDIEETENRRTPAHQNQCGFIRFFKRMFSKRPTAKEPSKDGKRPDTDLVSTAEFDKKQTRQDKLHKNKFSVLPESDESETDSEAESEKTPSKAPLRPKLGIRAKMKQLLTPERHSDDSSESTGERMIKAMKTTFHSAKTKVEKPKRKKFAHPDITDLKAVVRKASFDIASTSPASNESLKSKIGIPGDCKPIDLLLSGEEWDKSYYTASGIDNAVRKSKQHIKENGNTEKLKLSEIEMMELLAHKVEKVIDNADNAIKHPQPAKNYEQKIKQMT